MLILGAAWLEFKFVQHQHAELGHALQPRVIGEHGGAASSERRGDLERVGRAQAVTSAKRGGLLGNIRTDRQRLTIAAGGQQRSVRIGKL